MQPTHTCPLCESEAIPERCPLYLCDWRIFRMPSDTEAPTRAEAEVEPLAAA